MYVTDTHPLLWYAQDEHRKLSRQVKKIFDDCLIHGRVAIYLPTAVLWEISIVLKSFQRRLELSLPYPDFVDKLLSLPAVIEEPITSSIIKRSHELNFHADPFDILIVATALEKELPLITNDSVIHQHKPCELCWD